MPSKNQKPTPQNKLSDLLKRPLVVRVLLFVLAFLVISGLTGSWIIATNHLLFPFYFGIYGSAGKVLLFGMVVFLLLTKDQILKVPVAKWSKLNAFLALVAINCVVGFFKVAPELLNFPNAAAAPWLTLQSHLLLLGAGASTLVAIFGWQFLRDVGRRFQKPLLASLVVSTVFYFAFSYIFKLWPYLSAIVLWCVSRLLSLTVENVIVVPPLTIHLPQFAVTIGEYCSGIESLFLITVLYIVIGCVEWGRLRKVRYFAMYCPLIIGMFGLNIVRVYGIVLSGIWLSPEIAAKLFHTYLGMLLFLGYFFIFWKYLGHYLVKPITKPEKESHERIKN